MSLIRDIFAASNAAGRPAVSFEFFPTRTPEGERTLLEKTIPALGALKPDFCSVTYGAGGSTREKTLTIVDRIQREQHLTAMAHMTCVNATREETAAVLAQARSLGIQNILALRGDPPGGVGKRFEPHPQGYKNAADLVRGIRAVADFEVSVTAYPERHPESVSIEEDLAFMADKAEHGASRAISQFFFHNAFFLRLRDRIFARGIDIELVPGILPITNFARVCEFSAKCGAHIPPDLARRFAGLDADPETRNLVAAIVAAEQVEALRREGVNAFHFYTLNRADLVYAICRVLGLGTPKEEAA